jgi:coenzyme F420-dependent glucose-6-phosphate dehydrogenase
VTKWGYTLSSEEFPPRALVEFGHHAEDAGFDFLTVSDHFHPWVEAQGHSPFAWTTIGGVGSRTGTIRVGTGVTCPIQRYHPAIVAQAAASSASLLGAHRFFLGVGTGEWLNEHIVGGHWPTIETRIEMLTEATDIMRELWTGATVNHHGLHFTVENARLFTVPDDEIPIIWAASGTTSATAGAAVADGLWSTSPDPEVVDAYRAAGGKGPVYGQVTVCYAGNRRDALDTARRAWPNAGVPGQLSQDLATWTHFEQVAELVTEEKIAERIPCGPDPEPIAELVSKYTSAGFDHIHFHQVGPDQGGFLDFWKSTLSDSLG